jgi:hypothetical protein
MNNSDLGAIEKLEFINENRGYWLGAIQIVAIHL